MELTNKHIHSILLNGANQIYETPTEVIDILQSYTNEYQEEDISKDILKAFSVLSLKKKLAWQLQGAAINTQSLSPFIKKQKLAKNIHILLKEIFFEYSHEEKEAFLEEFVMNFDYTTWAFPAELYMHLLSFGSRNKHLKPFIINILGNAAFEFAMYKKSWDYINQSSEDSADQKTAIEHRELPNPALIAYAKEHIKHMPYNKRHQRWDINLLNQITKELKALGLKDRMYKEAGTPYHNLLIKLISVVEPSYWLPDNTTDRVNAYKEILLDAIYIDDQKRHGRMYKSKNTQNAIVRGFQEAATLYQDKDLIIAQYSLFDCDDYVYTDCTEITIGIADENLLQDADYERILLDYLQNFAEGKAYFSSKEPLFQLLVKWKNWTDTIRTAILTTFDKLFTKYRHYSDNIYLLGFRMDTQDLPAIKAIIAKHNNKDYNDNFDKLVKTIECRALLNSVYKSAIMI